MVDFEQYLKPTEFFDFNRRKVKFKAFEIIKGLNTDKDKSITLFYWTRDAIKYNMASYYMLKSNFKASVTLRRGYGACVSKAVLFSSFCRAVGIPARIRIVDFINHKISKRIIDYLGTNVFYCHGYSEIYLDDKWVKGTPAFDKETANKAGFLPLVEFDGVNHGIFSGKDPNGDLFAEYIKDRGAYVELPYNEMERVINKKYAATIERGFSNNQFLKK